MEHIGMKFKILVTLMLMTLGVSAQTTYTRPIRPRAIEVYDMNVRDTTLINYIAEYSDGGLMMITAEKSAPTAATGLAFGNGQATGKVVMPFAGTLVGLSVFSTASETVDLEFHVSGTSVAQVSLVAATEAYSGSLDVDVSAGEDIQFIVDATCTGVVVASAVFKVKGASATYLAQEVHTIALSAPKDDLAVADSVYTWTVPYNATIDSLVYACTTAPTGSGLTLDMLKNGTTMFSTKITIDATENNSSTAATAYVLTSTSLSFGDLLRFNRDAIGSTIPGQEDKIIIYLKR